jgi:hypothetical protein
MRYSWIDLVLYVIAAALLVPLVLRFVESVMRAIGETAWP